MLIITSEHLILQHHILYVATLFAIIAVILGIYCTYKIRKEIKEQEHKSDQEKRKVNKKLLKFLSKKKNTTY